MISALFSTIPLIRLLRRGSQRFDHGMLGMIVISGLASAGLLAIINAAANAETNERDGRLLAYFLVTIGVYIYTQRSILLIAIVEVEKLLHDIRVRVADRIRNSDLEALDHVGRSEIFGIVSRETQNISQAAATLITALQSLVMVFFSIAYIAILSKTAFLITVGMIWFGLVLHFRRSTELRKLLQDAQKRENDFLGALTHMLDGFKETRMSQTRSGDLYDHICRISHSVESVKARAGTQFSAHYVLTQAMLYGLLAGVVFLLPRLSPDHLDLVPKLTAAILFVIGPLSAIVGAAPLYSTANVASTNIFELEETLAGALADDLRGRPEAKPPVEFTRLDLRQVVFQYKDRGQGSSFRLGPVNLHVNQGEVVFLVGGNGSGKSTLLKTLTGLYHAQSGAIVLDDTRLVPETAMWYRSHFSPIFSDYHLFDRLYGLSHVPAERVNQLLTLMRIEDKTTFEKGRFTTLELSSGQRKRLALVVAMLEDRPILVLDEWAADQDPHFRKFFYEELIPQLKKQGKTIIAATHDDRYFSAADRVVKLEYGEQLDNGER